MSYYLIAAFVLITIEYISSIWVSINPNGLAYLVERYEKFVIRDAVYYSMFVFAYGLLATNLFLFCMALGWLGVVAFICHMTIVMCIKRMFGTREERNKKFQAAIKGVQERIEHNRQVRLAIYDDAVKRHEEIRQSSSAN